MTTPYPKRLIEVDLPIARISAHARREKSIRHGHISTLHIWWARRPLAACRAVILASLWPDPVDLAEWAKEADAKGEVRAPKGETLKAGEGVVIRPKRFLDEARQRMTKWSQIGVAKASKESYKLLVQVSKNPKLLDDPATLRTALLDFIADFADWDHSTDKDYLDTSRALVQAAHEALGIVSGTRPLVFDPFAGGGAIPLEALRVGADSFASDLNPLPILLNRVVLEYVPQYGVRLADEIRKWGSWVRDRAAEEVGDLYPPDDDGSTPIAYLWSRAITCEGPGCGIALPLVKNLALSTDGADHSFLQISHHGKSLRIDIGDSPIGKATVHGWSATCPACGFTTPKRSVQAQLRQSSGGSNDSTLLAVAVSDSASGKKRFRRASTTDLSALKLAEARRSARSPSKACSLSMPTKDAHRGVGSQLPLYGFKTYGDLYNVRQLEALETLAKCCSELPIGDQGLKAVVATLLGFCVAKQADYLSTLCRWRSDGAYVNPTLGGEKKYVMVSDYAEACPLSDGPANWMSQIDWVSRVIEREAKAIGHAGSVVQSAAELCPLPDDSASAMITDPPYYDSVPYSDLSNFFLVWLGSVAAPGLAELGSVHAPKKEEATVDHPGNPEETSAYEAKLAAAFRRGREIVHPSGIGAIVFAHKSTAGWEALLAAICSSGWQVVSSWPIDSEMATRLNARGTASLASSVHIVCRPRERASGYPDQSSVGEWREVLAELPRKLDEWMPRLANEGVVGADAIFACLGPALEVFSRYNRVEKASGEALTLREYLEHVWAAVSNEALSMIFKDADAAGLEPDARLTAMWLWTLGGGKPQASGDGEDGEETESDDEEEATSKKGGKVAGFVLEFDAARKIAQGLGIHLEKSESIVEVKGESARLLPVSERTRHLFGKDAEEDTAKTRKAKKKAKQGSLFEELDAIEAEAASTGGRFGGLEGAKPGATVLDKVHQSMILFAAGRGEALKRFLVDDGVGKDGRFWKLAQSLSALYPTGTDEKRWVDGVLARKKGLGF